MITKSKREYEIKDLTLDQRTDAVDTAFTGRAFGSMVKFCRFGLKTLDGKEITPENVEDALMSLSNDDIIEIGGEIGKLTNTSAKKKFS